MKRNRSMESSDSDSVIILDDVETTPTKCETTFDNLIRLKQSSLSPCSIYIDSSSSDDDNSEIGPNNNNNNNNHQDNDDDNDDYTSSNEIAIVESSEIASSQKSSSNSSTTTTNEQNLSHQQMDTSASKRRYNTRSLDNASENRFKGDKLKYNFVTSFKESHGDPIYNIQIFNYNEFNADKIIFATVGKNQASIYTYSIESEDIQLYDSYIDADSKESFFTCCWTVDFQSKEPLLAVGGLKGIIRTILPTKSQLKSALLGHGSSINELRIHPSKQSILLSASKDHTIRLWNLKNDVCIVVFGGCEGHRDEVLSADFNLFGTLIMSCSIDHSLKMWKLNTDKIRKAIEESENYEKSMSRPKFQTVTHHFPDFTTRDIHKNYIDCVRWLGDLVISKSCENCAVLWKPGLIDEDINGVTRTNKNVSILYTFEFKECDIWYVRFALDYTQRVLAVGTATGKLYVWNLDSNSPNDIKQTVLSNNKSKRTIRCTALSANGKYLLATNDEGIIFLWRQTHYTNG